jgi:hypothetical protein
MYHVITSRSSRLNFDINEYITYILERGDTQCLLLQVNRKIEHAISTYKSLTFIGDGIKRYFRFLLVLYRYINLYT